MKFGWEVRRLPATTDEGPYERIQPKAKYAPWIEDGTFLEVYDRISALTAVDKYRCYGLWTAVAQAAKLPGGILLEVGVWRGGTGTLIAERARACGVSDHVYLCDTFEGVVKAGPRDSTYRGGEFLDTSAAAVVDLAAGFGLDNITVLNGVFPDATGNAIPNTGVRFCHIDVDVFESARGVFEWVWPRVVIGGVVVFDDYGFRSCDGITAFVNDLVANRADCVFSYNLNGHALVVRVSA